MLTIACLSQKGGVGKSTLTRLIARTYAAADWRVKIADFNVRQTTCVDWTSLRLSLSLEPEIHAEAYNRVETALRQRDYHLLVMDGKPDADAMTLEIAKAVDLIVIPTGPTSDDLLPQMRFANELRTKKVDPARMVFCINGVASNAGNWTKAARAHLESLGITVAQTELPLKTAYQGAQNAGRAISETTFQALNDRAEALAEEIANKLKSVQRSAA